MQPIDATYFVQRWRSADAQTKQLLLFLFVDSIENADTKGVPPALIGPSTLQNRPGDAAFASYASKLSAEADFRLISVLTPIGPPLSMAPGGTDSYKLTDVVPLADEVTVHLKRLPDKELPGKHQSEQQFQLYHVWANQLALCYGPVKSSVDSSVTTPSATPSSTAPSAPTAEKAYDFRLYLDALSFKGAGGQSGGQAGGNKPPSSGSSSSKTGGAGAAPPQIASPIMPLVGFVPSSNCFAPLYIDQPNDSSGIREFQVNLRSVRGAIEYLGAILRSNAPSLTASDGTILFALAAFDPHSNVTTHPKLLASYEKQAYAVIDDNTGRTIAILSELVDSLKLSSDIATTKQVQIIP